MYSVLALFMYLMLYLCTVAYDDCDRYRMDTGWTLFSTSSAEARTAPKSS